MYLGIDVGGTNLAAGLTDGEGQILCKASVPVDRAWTDREIAGALSEMDDLTPEVKASLADMVKSLTEAMGDDVPEAIRNLDPEKIDFKTEGALLTTVADIIDADGNPASVNIKEAVENLSKSTVILPALAESSVTLPVDGETKAKAMEAIDELESRTGNNAVDAGTVAKLKALFGEKTPAGE